MIKQDVFEVWADIRQEAHARRVDPQMQPLGRNDRFSLRLSHRNTYDLGVAPSQDSSDHQEYYIFNRESL